MTHREHPNVKCSQPNKRKSKFYICISFFCHTLFNFEERSILAVYFDILTFRISTQIGTIMSSLLPLIIIQYDKTKYSFKLNCHARKTKKSSVTWPIWTLSRPIRLVTKYINFDRSVTGLPITQTCQKSKFQNAQK